MDIMTGIQDLAFLTYACTVQMGMRKSGGIRSLFDLVHVFRHLD
jgi:hypothetical protein